MRHPITTVGAAAEAVGIEPGAAAEVYAPTTALDPDAPLVIDPGAAGALAAYLALGTELLEALRTSAAADDAPSDVQLWPEHFDIGLELGDEAEEARGTFGASPGDAPHPLPYLYVTRWSGATDDPFWNDEAFAGASLDYRTLVEAPDAAVRGRDFFARRGPRSHAARREPAPRLPEGGPRRDDRQQRRGDPRSPLVREVRAGRVTRRAERDDPSVVAAIGEVERVSAPPTRSSHRSRSPRGGRRRRRCPTRRPSTPVEGPAARPTRGASVTAGGGVRSRGAHPTPSSPRRRRGRCGGPRPRRRARPRAPTPTSAPGPSSVTSSRRSRPVRRTQSLSSTGWNVLAGSSANGVRSAASPGWCADALAHGITHHHVDRRGHRSCVDDAVPTAQLVERGTLPVVGPFDGQQPVDPHIGGQRSTIGVDGRHVGHRRPGDVVESRVHARPRDPVGSSRARARRGRCRRRCAGSPSPAGHPPDRAACGSSSYGTTPVQSWSPVHAGTGPHTLDACRIGMRPTVR